MVILIKELWKVRDEEGKIRESRKSIIFNSSKNTIEESLEEYNEGALDKNILHCEYELEGEPFELLETILVLKLFDNIEDIKQGKESLKDIDKIE